MAGLALQIKFDQSARTVSIPMKTCETLWKDAQPRSVSAVAWFLELEDLAGPVSVFRGTAA